MTDRPLVLLDIDGVLHDRVARDRLRFADDPDTLARELGVEWVTVQGRRMAIPEHMPAVVQRLVDRAEVWWCTTWMDRANGDLTSVLDIEPLPVIGDGIRPTGPGWKADAARDLIRAAVAAGRTVAWIEDFDGDVPAIDGVAADDVTWIDTTGRGYLVVDDLPAELL